MHGVDEFEKQSVLVVDTHAGSAFALSSTLQAAGVEDIEAVQTLSGVRDRLNRGDDRDVSALILSDRILCGARDQVFRATMDMARTRGVAFVLWRTSDVAFDTGAFERSFDCRIVEQLDESMDSASMAGKLTALLAVQRERRRAVRREAELERELAELRVMETRLQHLVYHDELTGLWNRRRLKETLEVSVLRAANLHRPCSLLLIDMDRFKLVNDLEGYDAGDRMLVEMSRLLRRHIGPADTVARIGSDEFAMLLDNCGRDEAMERAGKLRSEFESYRFYYRERCYRTCVTIGVAVMPPGERRVSTSELMAQADQACFVGKQHGRNRVHCYSDHDPELERLRLDHAWAPRIREALENDRLFFCFQPIVRMLDGAVTHYECLLRLRDRDGKVHLPGEFIPVAERTGLIHHLDMWVVDRALDVLANLPSECAGASVSINLSGHAFRNWDLLELLQRRLEMCWVSPTRLVVEITETAAIENMVRGREIVARLRALGVRFALDDF
ncbi:MAG TPA: EAL domain-containing protein, partial [Gammaproteobacteria bacterium]|nr:EAL domain-containing protein [Gammaproteobacteria bacterium]